MIRTPLSTTSVVDEAAGIVAATATPWAGVLMLCALPYRFLQALFLDQLFETGPDAAQYGNLLGATANLIVLATLLALWGRAVYARACGIAFARGRAAGSEPFRMRPASFACYVLTAAAAMLFGWVSLVTVLGFFAAVMFAGLAIGTFELNERVSLTRPFALIFRYTRHIAVPFGLAFVFLVATLIALVNLIAAFQLLTWLASALGNFDAPNWQRLFGLNNRRMWFVLVAGALVVVEPFWIAAHVIYVRKAGAEESGDDLRAWFHELKEAS